ncbi:MAG TPA: bifunctional diguanylate cyclase/phosphodiesterase, partial [Acidimicrobiales bacterium]|nr:bifunctional diguanylate cyclase/phosphodiesterase [Acidimicrobiales bacterium]
AVGPHERGNLVAACFVDLDVFKLINDTHGHRTGDHIIRIAAERLSRRLREGDLLVRHGGDEFVAVLHDLESPAAALQAADRLRQALTEPFAIEGTTFDVTASAGVAVCSAAGCDQDDLLRQADIALYAAKARGRNQTVLFDDELEVLTEVAERQRRMLRHALDHDGVVMHFQPLVDSETGRPVAFEALARCLDPQGVLHGPGSFLDSISSSGMIWELDQRAFRLSCEAAAVLQRVVPVDTPVIGCNFSPLSIVQPDFASYVERTVAECGVEPANICIEITETAAFAGGQHSLDAVTTLHRAGFKIALDDFGTGYSSLSHLRDLPLHSVKMDRSFVARFTENGPEKAIAEAVVGLAGDLGLGVVAEGVETGEQLSIARNLGFRTIQGWHYDRAMPLDEILHRWVDTLMELAAATPG